MYVDIEKAQCKYTGNDRNTLKIVQLPVEVGAVVPKPPNVAPPKPVAAPAVDVAVLKPPNAGAGADVAGAPKPMQTKFVHSLVTTNGENH